MSVTEEVPTMSATDYAVEVFKRTHRVGDVGQWERSDAIRDAVDAELEARAPARADSGVNDGSYVAIAKVWESLQSAGIPDVQVQTIAKYRNVAQAWPEEDRVEKATYGAHTALVNKKYDGKRKGILRKLASKSVATRNDVRVWKSEQKPPKSVPWEQRFEKKLTAAFRSHERPQAPGEWKTAVQVLERLLDEARKAAANG